MPGGQAGTGLAAFGLGWLASGTGIFSGIFGGGGGPVSAVGEVLQLAPLLLLGGGALYAYSVLKK